eukprot:17099-Rhodomonas_salina.2
MWGTETRVCRLAEGSRVRHVQLSPDPDHVDSAVVVYLQIMDKEAYTQLRTKEQLGYIVCAEVHARYPHDT